MVVMVLHLKSQLKKVINLLAGILIFKCKNNLVVNAKFVLEDVKIYTVTYYDKANGQVLSSEGVVSGNNATPQK